MLKKYQYALFSAANVITIEACEYLYAIARVKVSTTYQPLLYYRMMLPAYILVGLFMALDSRVSEKVSLKQVLWTRSLCLCLLFLRGQLWIVPIQTLLFPKFQNTSTHYILVLYFVLAGYLVDSFIRIKRTKKERIRSGGDPVEGDADE